MSKPLIYLAGPITNPDPIENMREAIFTADFLMSKYPIVLFTPQLSVFQQAIAPRTHAEWLEYDLDLLESVDGILRIPGPSLGADMELLYAQKRGIPWWQLEESFVGLDVPDPFLNWLELWRAAGGEAELIETARAEVEQYRLDELASRSEYSHVA